MRRLRAIVKIQPAAPVLAGSNNDAFRQTDSRWGYNGKPTRSAADNAGQPVLAAGDEIAYHYGAGPDEGSPEVHLIDILENHCGSQARLTYRVFTGQEPGRWSGGGRF